MGRERSVGKIQKFHIRDPEDLQPANRLAVPSLGVRAAVINLFVPARPVGQEKNGDLGSACRQLGDETAATENVVVEMGRNDQRLVSAHTGRRARWCEVVRHSEFPFSPILPPCCYHSGHEFECRAFLEKEKRVP